MPKRSKIKRNLPHPDWSAAARHLSQDPVLRDIIAAVGPCNLKPRRDHFVLLCKAIYSQQLATTVANILFGRFRQCFPRRQPTPKLVVDLLEHGPADRVKNCGLSRRKREYLIDLAKHFLDNRIPNRRLSKLDDEQVIEALTAVHGIGRWTAEMFLMFVLNRPDILPIDDLGLQEAAKRAYKLPHRPNAKQLKKLGEPWAPWRTVASWYLWRASDVMEGDW